MIDSAGLLSDLQGETTTLVADLRARIDGEEPVRDPLEAEYTRAFDAGRTGRTFAEWSEERLTQVAVGWLLGCVFVRFCEDNDLLDDARTLSHPNPAVLNSTTGSPHTPTPRSNPTCGCA